MIFNVAAPPVNKSHTDHTVGISSKYIFTKSHVDSEWFAAELVYRLTTHLNNGLESIRTIPQIKSLTVFGDNMVLEIIFSREVKASSSAAVILDLFDEVYVY